MFDGVERDRIDPIAPSLGFLYSELEPKNCAKMQGLDSAIIDMHGFTAFFING